MFFLEEYKDDYEDIYLADENNYYKIYSAYNRKKEAGCKLKVINKNLLKLGNYDFLIEQIKREEEITKLCKSEYIVNLYRKFETQNNIIFEYEYCECNLLDYFNDNGTLERDKGLFKEIVFSVSNALLILHEKGIIHRNIKPSNIFIKSLDDEKKIIKLGNFDCSIYANDNKSMPIGTFYYAAPEIIKNLKYDDKCDLWSLGVTLFELYFEVFPYGEDVSMKKILEKIYDEENFKFAKTNIPNLDILFKILLAINPKERVKYDEFFNFVFNKDFMEEDVIFLGYNKKYEKIYNIILKEPIIEYNNNLILCGGDEFYYEKQRMKKLFKLVSDNYLPNVVDIFNSNNSKQKFNNIIYYNENISILNLIYEDINYFEKNCIGTKIILCNNIESLKLLKKEILKKIKIDRRFIFNLIISGNTSTSEKIINFLKNNEEYKTCIKNVCIYQNQKFFPLNDKYKIINDDNYNKEFYAINFINKFSSENIKPFGKEIIINYNCLEKYKKIYFKISQYYGDLTVENYKEYLKIIKSLNIIEEEIIESKEHYLTFDFRKDLNILERLIKKYYYEDYFYEDLNFNFINNNITFNEYAYTISRIIFELNSKAKKDDDLYCKENQKKYYKGDKLDYSTLMQYEKEKGRIIIYPNFLSAYDDENLAKKFSGRFELDELDENNLKFSVIFNITHLYKDNWISSAIYLNYYEDNKIKDIKDILFLPFTFFYVKDVKINLKQYTADIYLENIGKEEILEEQIKYGKEIEFNEKKNIIQIKK